MPRNGLSRRSLALMWLGAFAAILLMKLDTLSQVPVWDTVSGVFAPAIYLYENGFDLASLVKMPGWVNCGPNTHSFSLVTWITAIVLYLTGGHSATYPILHLLNYALAAFLFVALFRYAQVIFDERTTFFLCVSTLVFPLVSVQTGYMYMEIAGVTCVVRAFHAWSTNRISVCAIWLGVASAIKGFGTVAACTVAAALALEPRRLGTRCRNIVLVAAFPLLFELLRGSVMAAAIPVTQFRYSVYLRTAFWPRLKALPDVLLLMVVALSTTAATARATWATLRAPNSDDLSARPDALAQRRLVVSRIFIVLLATYLLAVPATGHLVWPLSRYFTWVVPFLLIVALRTVEGAFRLTWRSLGRDRWSPQRLPYATMVVAALFAVFQAVNNNGIFYPKTLRGAFSVVERDGSYKDFLAVQLSGVRYLRRLDPAVPVFLNRPDCYSVSSPLMGYVQERLPSTRFILEQPYARGRLSDYPGRFYLLYSNPSHGGEIMRSLWQQANQTPGYTAKATAGFRKGDFNSLLIEIGSER